MRSASGSSAILTSQDKLQKLHLPYSGYICQDPAKGNYYFSSEKLNSIAYFDSYRSELVPIDSELKFHPGRLHVESAFEFERNQKVVVGGTTVRRVAELKTKKQRRCRPSTAPIRLVDYCRVCYGQGSNDDPLLSICKCAGVTEFQHLECLTAWVKSKVQVRPKALFLPNKAHTCEICHESYLSHIVMRRILTQIVGFDNWELLECSQSSQRCDLYLFQISSEGVLIGRSETADLILSDRAVSRNHARLRCEGQKLVLEDLGSNWGTWCVASEAIPLLKYRSIVLLANGHTIEIRLHKTC